MTEDDLVDGIFLREGDTYADQTTAPPMDQPTGRGGITLGTLKAYTAAVDGQAEADAVTVETLRVLTHARGRAIVTWQLRRLEQHLDLISFAPLKVQMVDFAYQSGEARAIRWLQRVLRVERTGTMNAATVSLLKLSDPWLVNQALVAARLQMIDLWTDAAAKRKTWEEGVESRALAFSLLEVP